ncbi:MAG TPA: Gfo/Idh/MocA family oxidoreductase [Blastocatellia bacterium]|nr:Gfo/Idh/MocA family oxidoreductase [Blastocatellia bacterium]
MIKTAFVGCGGIADHYLSVYRDLEFVEMVSCVDASIERAELAATKLADNSLGKPKPRATTEFADALKPDVDLVVINTPNHLHREQTIAAFEAGKHVLLQKPVAANLADAEAIAAAAEQAKQRGLVSGLYLSYFDQPLMHDLKAMIEAGWFGDIAHLYARLMHRGGLAVSKQVLAGQANWRASLAETGGGCFIQLAVHYVHLFKWMMGARVVRVMAMAKNQHCPGIEGEDLACAILEFSNGALATIDMAWNTAGEQLSVHGTRGTCEYISNQTLMLDSLAGEFSGHVINYSGSSSQASPAAPGTAATQQISSVIAPQLGDWQNPFNQHRMFLEALRDHKTPFVSISSGAEDLRVVAAVYESAKTGVAIKLG